MDKAIFEEEQWYYSTYSWQVKGVYTFPKVNVILWVRFELAYTEATLRSVSLYTMG